MIISKVTTNLMLKLGFYTAIILMGRFTQIQILFDSTIFFVFFLERGVKFCNFCSKGCLNCPTENVNLHLFGLHKQAYCA